MKDNIKVYRKTTNKENIKTAKKWIQLTRVPHKDRLFSPVLVPRNRILSPDEISIFASAINTLLPDERVTDYITAGDRANFITTKKAAFSHVCHYNDFYADFYYLEADELGWHIIPQKKP